MDKARKKKDISLEDLYREVVALRRDVSLFIPTETLDAYKNKKEILAAYKKAAMKYPLSITLQVPTKRT